MTVKLDRAMVTMDPTTATIALLALRIQRRHNGTDLEPDLLAALPVIAAAAKSTQVSSAGQVAFSAKTMDVPVMVEAVARLAGVTSQAVRTAAREGRLVGWRPDGDNGRWVFTLSDVHRWIEDRERRRRVPRTALAKADSEIERLRDEYARLDSEVAGLEAQLDVTRHEAHNAREGAEMAEARGDAIAEFVSRETLTAVTATISALEAEVRQLNAERAAVAGPLDAKERGSREVDRLRKLVGLIEELAVVLDHLDKTVSAVQAWEDGRRNAGGGVVMPRPAIVADLLRIQRSNAYSSGQRQVDDLPNLRRQLAAAEKLRVDL